MSRRTSLPTITIVAFAFCCGCGQSSPDTPLVRALLLFSQEKLHEARVQCDQALTENPNNYHAWVVRGQINQRAGNFDAALVDFQRAIALDPTNPEAHFYRKALVRPDRSKPSVDPSLLAEIASLPLAAGPTQPTTQSAAKADYVSYSLSELDDDADLDPPKYPNLQAKKRPKTRVGRIPYQARRPTALGEPPRKAPPFQDHTAPPMDEPLQQEMAQTPPRQIVRFGFPLGAPVAPWVLQPPSTTGRRRHWEQSEPIRRRGLLVGQQLPPPRICTPVRPPVGYGISPLTFEPSDSFRPATSCADGLDNNGNGYTDQDDPACWADRTNPQTYSAELYEVQIPSSVVQPSPTVARPATLPRVERN